MLHLRSETTGAWTFSFHHLLPSHLYFPKMKQNFVIIQIKYLGLLNIHNTENSSFHMEYLSIFKTSKSIKYNSNVNIKTKFLSLNMQLSITTTLSLLHNFMNLMSLYLHYLFSKSSCHTLHDKFFGFTLIYTLDVCFSQLWTHTLSSALLLCFFLLSSCLTLYTHSSDFSTRLRNSSKSVLICLQLSTSLFVTNS